MNSDLDTDTAAARALFQSLEGMEGLSRPEPAVATTAKTRFPGQAALIKLYPGVLVAVTIALASQWLAQHYGAPVMLFALLFGMTFHFLHQEGRCIPGIEFSSKAILRFGVALLGARITASQILGLGLTPIITVIIGIGSTIALGAFLAKRMGLRSSFGVLSGGAVGICGASAALAIASVLPRGKDAERDTILAVVTVTALSTIAMITYPLLTAALHLDHTRAGIFLGGTIHDVAQVVGAGYMISPHTGDVATYVKLLRVTMLLPVVFTIAFVVARMGPGVAGGAKATVPLFLIGFAALVIINSLGWLAKPVTDAANEISRWCLVTAIAGLGMKTSFKDLMTAGWRPVVLMVVETVWIAGVVLVAVEFFT